MSTKYNNFLDSWWWKHLRDKEVKRQGNKCKACGNKKFLHLHHFNYRYKYSGKTSKVTKDTVVLCSGCHKLFHELNGVKKDMKKQTFDFIDCVKNEKAKMHEEQVEYYDSIKWISEI